MEYSIWRIYDIEGNTLGLLKTETFLSVIDVASRAKGKYGDIIDTTNLEYLGDC